MSKVITSTSGGRILRVLKALKGSSLSGRSNSELAKALDESPANINRALNTLIEKDWPRSWITAGLPLAFRFCRSLLPTVMKLPVLRGVLMN